MNTPLAWYFAGPLIGIIVPLLLILREKQFGISSQRWMKSIEEKLLRPSIKIPKELNVCSDG